MGAQCAEWREGYHAHARAGPTNRLLERGKRRRNDTRYAIEESAFEEFLYTGTPYADRIMQLYGDSKTFDESPWHKWADLVFVDGSHARSYVDSDSQKAMRIVKPGGLVLWHDYAGARHASGVFHALNALAGTLSLRHVRGTTFVSWRRPS
ncbi:MAG TPA: class I SAM-dependent methyltransferase [Gemmatimonas sp.]|nr:class I SAM-dependent methyltransferase [Gemmatimonas sp.]